MTDRMLDPALIARFDSEMEQIYWRAKNEIHYNATRISVDVQASMAALTQPVGSSRATPFRTASPSSTSQAGWT